METLVLRRLRVRYQHPASAVGVDRRVRAVLDVVTADALERALERLGVPTHEEVCVREVRVPVALDLRRTDQEVATHLSVAIAEELVRALRDGGPDVVRYGSRAQALADCVACTAHGDARRAWAWRRIGLPDGPTPRETVVRALLAHPPQIAAVLAAVAHKGGLPWLAQSLRDADWEALALAAVRAVDPTVRSLAPTTGWASDGAVTVTQGTARAETARAALRAVERSSLAAAWRGVASTTSPSARRAAAALVLTEVDPWVWRRPASLTALEVVEVSLRAPSPPLPLPPEHEAGGDRTSARVEGGRTSASTVSEGFEARGADRRARSPIRKANEPLRERANHTAQEAGSARPAPDAGEEERGGEGVPDDLLPRRERAWTAEGGLLFLLRVVGELDLPAQASQDPVLGARALRWTLHQLAMGLAQVTARDPVALAFAGLGPEDDEPSRGEPPCEEAEFAAVEALAERVREVAHAKLARRGLSRGATVAWLCRRGAWIVADPGWIEAHFSLEDVSVDIRRAGLDLDPGHVPWLGVVMRFVHA